MLLRHIRYLLAVVDHGGFTRAAEALHVSQPALSQQIRQLEESLGVQLLDRSGRAVRATDAGAAYVEHARRVVRELDAGKRALLDVADLARGELTLVVTPSFSAYLVAPLASAFHARHPGVKLSVQEMSLDRIEEALASDRADLGIAFTDVRSGEILVRPLHREQLSLIVGSRHPFYKLNHKLNAAVTRADFENVGLALLTRDFVTRLHIDAYLQRHKLAPRIAVEANSIMSMIEIVRQGHMATILPDAVALAHAGLHAVELLPALPQRRVALLSRAGAYQSAAARAFAALAMERAQAL